MDAKEIHLFLSPKGSWLRELLRRVTKNTTVKCPIMHFLWKGEELFYMLL